MDTHMDTHTLCFINIDTTTDLHTGASLHPRLHPRFSPASAPLQPTLLIKAERLQKVGANNKATYYL